MKTHRHRIHRDAERQIDGIGLGEIKGRSIALARVGINIVFSFTELLGMAVEPQKAECEQG